MKHRYKISVAGLLLLCASCTGTENTAKPPTTETTVRASSNKEAVVAKWTDFMRSALPSDICKPGAFLRECYAVSQEECEREAVRAVRICLEVHREDIQSNFSVASKEDVRRSGGKFGKVIGECAGQNLDLTFKGKASKDLKCSDVSRWVSKS
jgi:hypothetical protein